MKQRSFSPHCKTGACAIWRGTGLGLALAAAMAASVWAQSPPSGGVYVCVDAKGRRLTSDRPIIECLDREQKVLGNSGTVQRRIGPSLTLAEREAKEAQEKAALAERERAREEQRRDRAMATRYPNLQAHDKDRAEALSQIDQAIVSGKKRITDLEADRKKLDAEMEFYKKDPSKAPASLKKEIDSNVQSIEAQKRFIANQQLEKDRINARFDDELVKLRRLWAAQ